VVGLPQPLVWCGSWAGDCNARRTRQPSGARWRGGGACEMKKNWQGRYLLPCFGSAFVSRGPESSEDLKWIQALLKQEYGTVSYSEKNSFLAEIVRYTMRRLTFILEKKRFTEMKWNETLKAKWSEKKQNFWIFSLGCETQKLDKLKRKIGTVLPQFCSWDVLELGRFIVGTFWGLGRFVFGRSVVEVLSLDVL
jgi:hypothetical protein